MKLQNLMTTDVLTIGPDASLKEAARRMIEAGVSGLPVTDDDANLVGIITEADFVKTEADRRKKRRAGLLRLLTDRSEDWSEERLVRDVMTEDVLTLEAGTDHAEAARLMKSARIKRIPVVEEGRLVGLVSRTDMLKAFARTDQEILDEIENHVMREILWVDPRKVTAGCTDGNVKLSGQLETKTDASLLVELTKRLDGVVSVSDHLSFEVDNTKTRMVGLPLGIPRQNF
jgi:CBS-domain-containing membrane protein